jgi:LacI family transcriptional regulator
MLVNDSLVEKIAGLGTKIKELPHINTDAGSSKNIIFILPRNKAAVDRISEPFNSSLFYRIERECKARGYSLIYATSNEMDGLSDVLNGNCISGIVFVSKIEERLYDQAAKLKLPVVLVNNRYELFTSVVVDNEKGAYETVKYLTGLGHKRIAIIRGKEGYMTSSERFEGYKKALMDSNINWQDQIIKDGDWTFDGGYNAMTDILKNCRQLPTAVFASNDITAFGAMEAMNEAGLSVPEDISLVGFDDIDQCKFMRPQLTSVKVDVDVLGKVACQHLFNSIEYGQQLNIRIEIPTTLVIRESTAKI